MGKSTNFYDGSEMSGRSAVLQDTICSAAGGWTLESRTTLIISGNIIRRKKAPVPVRKGASKTIYR